MKIFLLASLLLCVGVIEDVTSHRSRTRRELAPGLHTLGIRDPGGSYCQRRDSCCPGRNDVCTMPYMDTICYCDLFCNRTVSDCCPDFWEFCLHISPPANIKNACVKDGRNYPTGATQQDNCNRCTCTSEGRWHCEENPCLINPRIIDTVNQGSYGWRAGNYSTFWGMTLDEGIQYRLGTTKPSSSVMNMNELHVNMDNDVLPSHFNAADKWPGMIHEPLDQGNCAGSWAFSTAAVASDRLSIQTLGLMTPTLSAQNLLSCDIKNQHGCRGGRLDGAWWYLRRRGVVTEDCYPFSGQSTNGLPAPCMMHSRSMGRGKRQATAQCPNPYASSNEIYQSTPAYRLSSNVKEIMKEIYENGPVQAIMEVHEDFFMYQNGIYRHIPVMAGEPERFRRHGTHSVRITGWGEEIGLNGQIQKYWLAANSWGKDWGEGGYFRIARGENECEIETFVLGVWGRVSMEDVARRK
ncbi:tubulointerstitial nephritis antigen-like [Hyperolius riggenbachi]|uniref:tubulointerstitial nephritis antigen-like n=1 Tax=Hyperolius riggenbachi TaxID=752182 RepID=UPI0035A302CB